jgi:transmembrane sensor
MGEEAPEEARARREAADWFARLNSRVVTTEALKDFFAWRAEPANSRAYAALEEVWRQAGRLEGDPDIAVALRAALDRPAGHKTLTHWIRALDRRALRAIAIAGLAAVAAGLLVLTHDLQTGVPYVSGIGEQRLITLEDGSRLRLDTNTKLRVFYDDQARRVVLARGRAFFDVAHDAARPFTVRAGETTVRALGTRFDVRRDDREVRVTLVDGRVRVDDPDDGAPGRWTLEAGQQLTVGSGDPRPLPRRVDTAAATSWTSGRLVFRSAPLATAIAEVNRYSPRPVRLEAEGLARTQVSGVFDAGDVEAFAAAVASLFDLETTRKDDGTLVLRARAAAG